MSLGSFFSTLDFDADPFQLEAAEALAAGRSVVVTAPTGSGKTLVAEAGTHLALERGRRVFYTTPLKALSNQKFGDFSAEYGPARVGLLTGDNSIRGDAPLVVMTTEVLRNMIYADSAALDGLGLVVLDEVHYLQDPFRGMVWEEVIIHLPLDVQVACLSATIANPEEFTSWVEDRRGATSLIVERQRPVPLHNLYLFKQRHHGGDLQEAALFTGSKGRPNTRLARLLSQGRNRYGRFGTPRRTEVASWLQRSGMLPAIYFVFSRRGCDEAAAAVAGAMTLTSADEKEEITDRAADRSAHLPPEELAALGYGSWVETLRRGVAAHHAGLVPAFKETVEDLFSAGILKLVFATETLSLGINMPARSVVLDKLSRFTGEGHRLLEPGDYTQLTGRAGRRGIDDLGTAVVLHSRFVPFDRVVGIAGPGSHPLQSSFRPNYNMAVNLVANYTRPRAEDMLRASFGQFQRRRRHLQTEARVGELQRKLDEARAAAECTRGDIWSFSVDGPGGHGTRMRAFAGELEIGDVLHLTEPGDKAVMMARGFGSNPRLLLLGGDGRLRRVGPEELPATAARVGHIELPAPYRPRERRFRRAVLENLRRAPVRGPRLEATPGGPAGVAGCPDMPQHLQWARRTRRLEEELAAARHRAREPHSLITEFDAIVGLLQDRGYMDGWELTPLGRSLRRIYNEADLLVAETWRAGVLEDLPPPETAALVSVFVHDPRRDAAAPVLPTPTLQAAWADVLRISTDLAEAEKDRAVTPMRVPHPGFVEAAYMWASGASLQDVVTDDLSGGDFVRTCRQTIDLLRQLAETYGGSTSAGPAARALDRGVVAAGGVG